MNLVDLLLYYNEMFSGKGKSHYTNAHPKICSATLIA